MAEDTASRKADGLTTEFFAVATQCATLTRLVESPVINSAPGLQRIVISVRLFRAGPTEVQPHLRNTAASGTVLPGSCAFEQFSE